MPFDNRHALPIYLKSAAETNVDRRWSHYAKPQPDPRRLPWSTFAAVVDGMMYNRTLRGVKPGQTPWNDQDAPYGALPC